LHTLTFCCGIKGKNKLPYLSHIPFLGMKDYTNKGFNHQHLYRVTAGLKAKHEA